ncbi:hypothetical protein K7432_012413 [Basidiobolus ranarum]|uniref:F-box domain-containing protein n=1 Tax=Basidiobolus ranarum TaxID=34480 RepID=A0ABR2WKX0_9FUNG
MSQPHLSRELIPLILVYLVHEKNTLHSLLTVNKLFFSAAAPILYKNPFRSCFWRKQSETKKREILYLLLASANLLPELEKCTTKILRRDFTDWEPPTAPFTVNYLDYYTEVDYSEWKGISTEYLSYIVSNSSEDFGFGHIINHLFCKYNAEKIKSICLPILDMKPYLPIASKMSTLRRIEFCRVHGDGVCGTNDENIVTIQDAIEFVQIHVATFGSTLTEIKIPDFSDLGHDGIQSDIQTEDIINILKRPQVIDAHDSYNFCQHLQGSTPDNLRVFGGPLMYPARQIQDWDSASLFQRCPKLEKIRFNPSQANSFRWAAEKRAILMDSGSESNNVLDDKLAPLQDVDMMCKHCPALPIVQDIVYAFRYTIKNITAVDNHHSRLDPDPLCWDWLLPNLVKIHIREADLSLFDFGSLNMCPSLEELHLTDKYAYRSSSTVTEFGPVLMLPNLRKIRLEFGMSAKFDFGSLQYSPLLESLILHETGSSLPLRSADSPCWTWSWDWDLPNLKELYLSGEAAVLFQFRLLDSCPPLERLRLSIEGFHRSLSLDEIPQTDLSLPLGPADQAGLRDIPNCKSLFFLNGGWELSGKTLSAILQRYMPHVTEIQLTDTLELTVADVINVTQKLNHVQYVYSTLCLTDTDIEQSGMHVKDSGRPSTGWRCMGTIDSVTYHMVQIPN